MKDSSPKHQQHFQQIEKDCVVLKKKKRTISKFKVQNRLIHTVTNNFTTAMKSVLPFEYDENVMKFK